jgi:uncharacterized protein YxeA
MDNKTLIGIIIILLIGIGGAYYLKTNNTAENPPQIQNPECEPIIYFLFA